MANRIPGIRTSFDRNTDPGNIAPNNRLLLWGMVPAAAPVTLNAPLLAISQRQVETQCLAYSQLARLYKAARATPGSIGAEVWVMPVAEPSGGTKATHFIVFVASPTYDPAKGWILGTNTAALYDTQCEIDIAGQVVTFGIAAGATFAAITAAAEAALDAVSDLVVVASSASPTVTLTDRFKGEHGNDLPIRVTFSNPAAGISASPGTITYATDATGDGVTTLTADHLTAQAAIANTNTPVIVATAMRDAVNAAAFPLRAAIADPASGVVTLYYKDDWYCHRLSVADTAAGMTATGAFGTAGAGVPAISAALTNLTAGTIAYKAWCFPGTDAASWGSLATHIIAQDATPIEKGQFVVGCITGAPSGLADSTTPKLNSSELFSLLWAQGAVVRGGELAARAAMMVAVETFAGRNFNGRRLLGSEAMALGIPHQAARPGRDTQNTAIETYQLAPVVVDDAGYNAVLLSRTTFKSAGAIQDKLTKWSGALIPMYFRASLRVRLGAVTAGKNLKVHSEPQTENAIGLKGIRGEVFSLMKGWDLMDLYDGAEGMREAVKAGVSATSATGVVVDLPFRTVADLDWIDIQAYQK